MQVYLTLFNEALYLIVYEVNNILDLISKYIKGT